MNKKLIAVALAALPVAAMADVTLYGKIKMGVENVKEGDSSSVNRIDDIGTRIGFKGSEDLGNGLKAIWQVEQKVSIDDKGAAGGTWASRDSFLGFQGDFGKVKFGRLSTFQNSDMEDVDPYEYGNNAMGLGTFTRNDGRVNNAVRYDSPEFAGFNATVLYGADETAGVNKDTWNLGLGYKFDAFFAKYSYLRQNSQNPAADKDNQSHRVEAGYSANNLLVAVGYQQTKSYVTAAGDSLAFNIGSAVAGDEVKDREAVLTVAYTMGALTPKLSLAKGWDVKVDGDKESDTGYKQYVVGVDYALSKRTVLGAQYGKLNFDGGSSDDIRAFGVNAVHSF
ncbi:porin [Pseudogulbenkiania sp. MAI-1]|uniref:porin n=1 Tax=Pseudogulbenkiania sp. MAI-1 TaxID=990370 RepID=UPI00045E9AF2|nr:porin [Pseudogulbenkiania sp. MAI-1]